MCFFISPFISLDSELFPNRLKSAFILERPSSHLCVNLTSRNIRDILMAFSILPIFWSKVELYEKWTGSHNFSEFSAILRRALKKSLGSSLGSALSGYKVDHRNLDLSSLIDLIRSKILFEHNRIWLKTSTNTRRG